MLHSAEQLSNLTERLLVCHCFHWSDPSAVSTSQTCFTSNGMPHMTAALALGNAQSFSAVLHMSFQRATAKADSMHSLFGYAATDVLSIP